VAKVSLEQTRIHSLKIANEENMTVKFETKEKPPGISA
jgi:hypothetical protein